jgi:hypothetical protein
MQKSPEEQWAEKQDEIAEELRLDSARLTNGQVWAREAGFWVGLLLFLTLMWALAGGFIPS